MTSTFTSTTSAKRCYRKYYSNVFRDEIIKNYQKQFIPFLITYFTIQNVGLRPLQYFCNQILGYSIEIKQIQKMICNAGKKANMKLQVYDKKMGEFTTALEMDTTWKGRSMKFLAAIDHHSNYLFCLDPLKHETNTIIQPRHQYIMNTCCNLKVLITDMALNFLSIIPHIFRGIIHLFCHNHVLKAIDREMPIERQSFLNCKKKLKKLKGPLKNAEKWLGRNRKKLYNSRSYDKKLRNKKRKQCIELGIPVKKNGAIKEPRNGLPQELKKISNKIYILQSNIIQFGNQVSRQIQKKAKILPGIKKTKKKYY